MAKESRKCDSLRVAYNLQYSTLQELVIANLDYFKQVREEEAKRIEIQKQLDESIKALRNKKNNWIVPAAIGTIGGLIGGFIITN